MIFQYRADGFLFPCGRFSFSVRTAFLFHCAMDFRPLHGGHRYTARRTSVPSASDFSPQHGGHLSIARWTRVHSALDSSPPRCGLESGNVWKIAGLGKLRKTDDDFVFMRRLCRILTFRQRCRLPCASERPDNSGGGHRRHLPMTTVSPTLSFPSLCVRQVSLWMTRPERSLGSNHVALGGMILPLSAMSMICFIVTG